ncbi:MAG: TspO/MBR family protein [Rhizomicrobium sp.]
MSEKIEMPQAHKTALLGFVLVAEAAGAAASLVTRPAIESWFPLLLKPSFQPPDWLFAPVWVALYALMAWAAWRVWRVRGLKSPPIILYAIQLALNCAWSFVFFGGHRIGLALIEIAILFVLVIATAAVFWRNDRWAGALMLPYIAWLGYATALNGAIFQLNGGTF